VQRVVILGPGASGKSTLAVRLGQITGLPVIEAVPGGHRRIARSAGDRERRYPVEPLGHYARRLDQLEEISRGQKWL
jgi:nicotinamide riboside kinase